ncbi:MAG: response regulator [Gammaproteobacteria bacterium]|nr:response regulator [Gammaproteobacteria bacterium]
MTTPPAIVDAEVMPPDVRLRRTPTVYIVERDEAVRRSLTMLCRGSEFAVSAYASVQALLENPRPKPPGCIIVDDQLPDMNALQILQALHEADIGLPIIILGADSDVQTAVNTMRAGAFYYLEKPYLRWSLLESVSEAVERSHAPGLSSSIKTR